MSNHVADSDAKCIYNIVAFTHVQYEWNNVEST